MPSAGAARNLRNVTPGAETDAAATQYPITEHGPSASSRAKAELAAQTRAAAVATGGPSDLVALLADRANGGALLGGEDPGSDSIRLDNDTGTNCSD